MYLKQDCSALCRCGEEGEQVDPSWAACAIISRHTCWWDYEVKSACEDVNTKDDVTANVRGCVWPQGMVGKFLFNDPFYLAMMTDSRLLSGLCGWICLPTDEG